MLGKASSLTIAGFILTPRTLGARVMLTREQLTVYHQNDLEPFTMLPQNKSRPPDTDSADTRGCEPTLRPLEDVEAGDIAGPVRGRRAHITLTTAPGVKPVQTGLDQLDALLQAHQQSLQEKVDLTVEKAGLVLARPLAPGSPGGSAWLGAALHTPEEPPSHWARSQRLWCCL